MQSPWFSDVPNGPWLGVYVTMWIVLLMETGLLILLIRQVGYLHVNLMQKNSDLGLPLGAPAPAIDGRDLFGRQVSYGSEPGMTTLVFFLSVGCPSCKRVMELLPAFEGGLNNSESVLVFHANEQRTRLYLAEMWPSIRLPRCRIIADQDGTLSRRFRTDVVPYLTVVDRERMIGAKGTAASIAEVRALYYQAEALRKRRQQGEGDVPVDSQTIARVDVTNAVVSGAATSLQSGRAES